MCTEVRKHQHIETGGNLFGLWTTSGSAVIHVVLGPGKNCRRTETSFHQDIEYLNRVGRFVNDNYMFCHIGEWHSHHSLGIKKPSTGDEQTIRCNFPEAVAKLLVIFATIKNTDIIVLSPYFFIDEGRRYEKAELVVLDSDNAFSHDVKIMAQVQFGAEGVRHQLAESNRGGVTLTTKENPLNTNLDSEQSIQACFTCPRDPRETSPSIGMNPQPQKGNNSSASNSQAKSTSSQPSRKNANNVASIKGSDSETKRKGGRQTPKLASQNTKTRQNEGSKSQRDGISSLTYNQPNLSSTQSKPDPNIPASNSNASQSQAHPHKLKSKDDQSISHYQVDPSLSNSQDTPSESNSGDSEESMDTDDSDRIPRDKDISSSSEISPSESETITPVGSPAEPDRNKNDVYDERPSEKEIVLKKIYDELKYWFGTKPESSFNFQTSNNCPGAIEIRFKHNYKYWMIRFPADFPATPAKLFHTSEDSVRLNECAQFDLVEPLNDEVNILLTVKNICRACKICKKFTKESLSRPDFNLRNMDKLADFAHEFVRKLDKYFPDFTECNINHSSDTSHATIRFEHNSQWWIIKLLAKFPDAPAKVYNQLYKESPQRREVLLYETKSPDPRDLNTSKLIINAINCNCSCSKCEKFHEGQY